MSIYVYITMGLIRWSWWEFHRNLLIGYLIRYYTLGICKNVQPSIGTICKGRFLTLSLLSLIVLSSFYVISLGISGNYYLVPKISFVLPRFNGVQHSNLDAREGSPEEIRKKKL